MMGTQTLILIFFSLCGVGILFSLKAPTWRQGNVLTWLGCLAAIALALAGASGLLDARHIPTNSLVPSGIDDS